MPPSFHFDTGRHRLKLDGFDVPSVTRILGALPKDALKFWAAKSVAEWAFDHREAWKDLPRDAAVDLLKREPLRFTSKRARVGTAVHGAVNAYALGFDPPDDLTDEEWGFFNGALAYLTEQKVEVLRTETTVYSRTHLYGGTFDLLQRRGDCDHGYGQPDERETCPCENCSVEIADFKTSKAVYPDVALQLVAYARADFIGDAASGEELELPKAARGLIVRLAADGSYEAVPCQLDDEVWAAFLSVRGVFDWMRGISARVLEPALRRAA